MILERLIGIPYVWRGESFSGCDCWGLCKLYYELKGRALPSIEKLYQDDSLEMGGVKDTIKPKFIEVPLSQAIEGDICLFNIRGLPVHVAIYLDNNTFLHCIEGANSSLGKFKDIKYKNKLDGVWRPNENLS